MPGAIGRTAQVLSPRGGIRLGQIQTVVLANSDLIDKLGVVVFPSIPLRAPIVRFLNRTFRLLSEPCGAAARDPRPSPSTRRSASAVRQQLLD